MSDEPQHAIRWEPLAGIPETPCADVDLQSPAEVGVTLRLRYSLVVGNQADLVVELEDVRGFRSLWDGERPDSWDQDPPRCVGEFDTFYWPLLVVQPSHWLQGSDFQLSMLLAEVAGEEPWTHYRIATLARTVDVAARSLKQAYWTTSAS